MNESKRIVHPLSPVFDCSSRVLILGTMPSPKSRALGFYYAHPQNRFWPVMAALWAEDLPQTAEERRAFALRHHFALWDVLASCSIAGASDASIRDAVPNDLTKILTDAPIRQIITTGQTAGKLYQKYIQEKTGMPPLILPSTSPANCRLSTEALTEAYRVIRKIIEEQENH